MVQGLKKVASRPKKPNSAKNTKQINNQLKTKKGNSLQYYQIQNFDMMQYKIQSRFLSKAIARESEIRVTSKLIQGGGKIGVKDLMQKGKK